LRGSRQTLGDVARNVGCDLVLGAKHGALGPPVRIAIGLSKQNDIAVAGRRLCAGRVIADRADDALQFHDVILDHAGKPVIPSLLLFND
jgi:hypothetical protein